MNLKYNIAFKQNMFLPPMNSNQFKFSNMNNNNNNMFPSNLINIQQQINPQIQQKLPQQQHNKQIIQPQFNPQIQEKLPQNQQYQQIQ